MRIQKNMSAVIRALKDKNGKSLAEFSAELEISRSTMQKYLSGNCNPSINTVNHLAKKLGVDTAFLVSGAFSSSQLDILLTLLDSMKLLSDISPDKREHFAELLIEMLNLWNDSSEEK